jgi:hypothetical protein
VETNRISVEKKWQALLMPFECDDADTIWRRTPQDRVVNTGGLRF